MVTSPANLGRFITHVRYRGLAKNRTRFEVLFALANLYLKRRILLSYCIA